MGCLMIAVGGVFGLYDLFSIRPHWWSPLAWVVVLVGVVFALAGI